MRATAVGLVISATSMSITGAGPALALDELVFGTNWVAEAEHGGYYQAVANGTYEDYGLDVTIRPGGPQVNHAQLLAAEKIDLYMGGSMFGQFNFVESGVPVVTVAAIFQKEPQVLLAHPDAGIEGFEDLAGKPILLSKDGELTFWLWLKSVYGLQDSQLQPYTFNPAPFIADPNSVQQGYVTSEPFAVEQVAGFAPKVLVMADAGYDTYSTTIITHRNMIDDNPDLVQRFVSASIEGWYSYLYGDPTPGNDAIKADNPEMSDEQIGFTIDALKKYGIVDSGDAEALGIGAMTDERWQSFFDKAVSWGVYGDDLPLETAYLLEFVNQGHGLDLKRELVGK